MVKFLANTQVQIADKVLAVRDRLDARRSAELSPSSQPDRVRPTKAFREDAADPERGSKAGRRERSALLTSPFVDPDLQTSSASDDFSKTQPGSVVVESAGSESRSGDGAQPNLAVLPIIEGDDGGGASDVATSEAVAAAGAASQSDVTSQQAGTVPVAEQQGDGGQDLSDDSVAALAKTFVADALAETYPAPAGEGSQEAAALASQQEDAVSIAAPEARGPGESDGSVAAPAKTSVAGAPAEPDPSPAGQGSQEAAALASQQGAAVSIAAQEARSRGESDGSAAAAVSKADAVDGVDPSLASQQPKADPAIDGEQAYLQAGFLAAPSRAGDAAEQLSPFEDGVFVRALTIDDAAQPALADPAIDGEAAYLQAARLRFQPANGGEKVTSNLGPAPLAEDVVGPSNVGEVQASTGDDGSRLDGLDAAEQHVGSSSVAAELASAAYQAARDRQQAHQQGVRARDAVGENTGKQATDAARPLAASLQADSERDSDNRRDSTYSRTGGAVAAAGGTYQTDA